MYKPEIEIVSKVKTYLQDLLSSGKAKYNNTTHDYEVLTQETLEALNEKNGRLLNAGYCLYGEVDITISRYCASYLEKQCPPHSQNGWKNCCCRNIPCDNYSPLLENNR